MTFLAVFVFGLIFGGIFVALMLVIVAQRILREPKQWPNDLPGRELDDRDKPWTLLDPIDWQTRPEQGE